VIADIKFESCLTVGRHGVKKRYEDSKAEVVQLIAGTKFSSFLTPDMASKNDARHGIGFT